MTSCLVTGAGGFIGRALIPNLRKAGYGVSTWPRHDPLFDLEINGIEQEPPTAWIQYLQNIDVVVHLAALAHQNTNRVERERYFRLNRNGTLRIAAAARIAGVKRFIFMSTAKIFGEGANGPYDELSPANPGDVYSLSKWQAEQQLLQLSAGSEMEVVILRPPLVYGIGAKANFARLLQIARLPVPLPFAGIDNRRAMIGIDNLVDLIKLCILSPKAAGRAWLCADDRMYSLSSVFTIIRRSFEMEPKLFRLPFALQQIIKTMLGPGVSARLYGDFALDCSATRQHLDWLPPYSMEQILRAQLDQKTVSKQA